MFSKLTFRITVIQFKLDEYSFYQTRPHVKFVFRLSLITLVCVIWRVVTFKMFFPFVPKAPFLCLLKTSENLTVFSFFQGIEKGCVRNKWVKRKALTSNITSEAATGGALLEKVFSEISRISQENTCNRDSCLIKLQRKICDRVSSLIKLQGSATLLEKDSGTGAFLWIMRNF